MHQAPADSDGVADPGWLPGGRLIVFLAVALGAFLVSLGPITDGDLFWHLAAGREMVERRAWLHVDPFTISAAGRTWIDVHWLFQLGAYLVFLASGFFGLIIAKASLIAVGAVILTRMAESTGGATARSYCAVATLAGLILARHLLPMRPVIVTLFFMAIFLLVLEWHGPWRVGRSWIILPWVQAIWSNCQGLSPLGPILVAMYLAGAWFSSRGFRRWPCVVEERTAVRPLALTLGLCVLASFATPFGPRAIALSAHLLGRITPSQSNIFSTAVAENIPPWVLVHSAPELVWHFNWVLIGLAVLFILVRPRLRLAHLLMLGVFLGLALMASRNIPLFYWVAGPVAGIAFAPGLSRLRATWIRPTWWKYLSTAGLTILLGGELVLASVVQFQEPTLAAPTPFHFPVESTRRLIDLHITGPVFTADQHGGYLTFASPALRPYIDTRLVLHTGQEYADYLALFDDPGRFDTLDEKQQFRAVVLTTTYPDRYLGLICHLVRSKNWRLVYTDGSEVLFLREGARLKLEERSTIDGILKQLAVRFAVDAALYEAARLNLARLLVVLGHQATYVLASLDSLSAAQLRARAHFVAGELSAAEGLAQILVAQDPQDVRALVLLAEIAASEGRFGRATGWLRRALAIDPYDAEIRSLIERMARRGEKID